MYDFETIINRKNTGSFKWDAIIKEIGPDSDDIIPMSVADMELKAAPEITEAIKSSADSCIYGYTGPTQKYFDAVVHWMKKRHNWEIDQNWISLSSGVVPAFYNAIRAITHPGDKILIQQPVYYPFSSAIKLNGCSVVNNELVLKDEKYYMDFDDLDKKASDPRVKALLLCNPHNPVGRVWTFEELRQLGEICLKNDVIVISDEIHFDFIFKPYKHTVFASICKEFEQNCMILTAPSKTFNLAGLQCSNIIIPNVNLKSQYDIAAENTANFTLNYFAYPACEAAYTKGEKWLDELLQLLEENKSFLKEYVAQNLPMLSVIEPEGTYLVWIDCRALKMNDQTLERFMKEKARVFFDEGYIFGKNGSGFERINIACPKTILKKVLDNLKAAVDSQYK